MSDSQIRVLRKLLKISGWWWPDLPACGYDKKTSARTWRAGFLSSAEELLMRKISNKSQHIGVTVCWAPSATVIPQSVTMTKQSWHYLCFKKASNLASKDSPTNLSLLWSGEFLAHTLDYHLSNSKLDRGRGDCVTCSVLVEYACVVERKIQFILDNCGKNGFAIWNFMQKMNVHNRKIKKKKLLFLTAS